LRPEKCQPIHHKSPRFHHKFTTKKPRFAARFFKNPLQKRKNSIKQKLPKNQTAEVRFIVVISIAGLLTLYLVGS